MPRTRLAIFLFTACLAIASCGDGGKEPAATDETSTTEETEESETPSGDAGDPYPEVVVSQFIQGCTGSGQSRKYCECVIERMQATVPFAEASVALSGGDQQEIADFFEQHRAEIVEPCLKFAEG